MGCPASHCSGGWPDRQHQITVAQLEQITGAAGADAEENQASVCRCNYCGTVYVRADGPRILGVLNDRVIGEGWHPAGSR